MADTSEPYQSNFQVLKTDPELGIVFAWGLVCSKGGEPYSDTDDERVEPVEMLKAAIEFGELAFRPMDTEHDEIAKGGVVGWMPMTDQIAKAFGIEFEDDPDQVTEGLMIIVKPEPAVFKGFQDGTYTGFSMGGRIAGWEADEEVAA